MTAPLQMSDVFKSNSDWRGAQNGDAVPWSGSKITARHWHESRTVPASYHNTAVRQFSASLNPVSKTVEAGAQKWLYAEFRRGEKLKEL